MEIIFQEKAIEDLEFWQKSGNLNIKKRIESLLISILETPFGGKGKPEPLKHNLAGMWSRRIYKEHKLFMKSAGNIFIYTH